jgi:hypothetical protein
MGSPPPPFLVILCVSVSVFYKKASEIKHVNFIVDILVYDELKNVVQNLLLSLTCRAKVKSALQNQ